MSEEGRKGGGREGRYGVKCGKNEDERDERDMVNSFQKGQL